MWELKGSAVREAHWHTPIVPRRVSSTIGSEPSLIQPTRALARQCLDGNVMELSAVCPIVRLRSLVWVKEPIVTSYDSDAVEAVRLVFNGVRASRPVLVRVAQILLDHAPRRLRASEVAEYMGMASRYSLTRKLRAVERVSFRRVQGLTLSLFYLSRARLSGLSLEQQAYMDGCDPSTYYRRVQEGMGRPWRAVRGERPSGAMRRSIALES